MPMDVEIPIRPDGLQLDESRSTQRVIWIAQRFLWISFVVVVALALAGATGRGGPLARQEVAVESATLAAPRVTRRGAIDTLEIAFATDRPDHHALLPADLLSRFEVEAITPRPVAEVAASEGTALLFAATGSPPHHVRLDIRARRTGTGQHRLILDGQALRLSILALP